MKSLSYEHIKQILREISFITFLKPQQATCHNNTDIKSDLHEIKLGIESQTWFLDGRFSVFGCHSPRVSWTRELKSSFSIKPLAHDVAVSNMT